MPDPDFTHPIPPEGPAEATAHRLNAWMAEVLNKEESDDLRL
jgi:hypothetical protein